MDPLVVKERRALWLSRIQNLAESGMTQKAWCQRKEIPVTTLRYWLRKLRLQSEEISPTATGTWLELTQACQPVQAASAIKMPEKIPTLVLRTDQFALEFYEQISPVQLSEYLKELAYR